MSYPNGKNLERNISNLVKRHGTPLVLISKKLLTEQVEKFKRLLPRVTPYYAIKANSHEDIVKTFVKLGTGFDVASKYEMELALKCGAKPKNIVFANPIKPPETMRFAMEHGVDLTVFDSEYELYKIAENAPGARVLVRIKVPNIGSVVELSLKFGADPVDAIPLLIKAHKLGLKPTGLAFHVGSQCTHVENYIEAFEMGSIIMHDAKLKQIPLSIVDIGGGMPIQHFDDDEDYFAKFAPAINKEIDRLYDNSVQLMAEPGRSFAGPACTLVTRVMGKSIRENKPWYYLDDGLYGTLSGILYDFCKYQYNVFKRGLTHISTLAGPTCDSHDIIARSVELPELDINDIVYVQNIGAYSTASTTNFNGILPAKTVFLP
ncbi:MAG: type III PLP-dependent enzyme [Deltaproteobacteria bacterium]|nr:type III PLP-dependent enzyme [Deltaproteobacteria bacterium]MBI2341183.1 type III PLP-dependent enzyme [Deltaproteobacteria bacterium]MBI2974687.1 type III PLP-dependent enzyme [Deltaproteobacteria bacterium]